MACRGGLWALVYIFQKCSHSDGLEDLVLFVLFDDDGDLAERLGECRETTGTEAHCAQRGR